MISSYNKSSDHLFHSKNLIDAFITQGRKVLVIDITGELDGLVDKKDYQSYASSQFLSYTKSTFLNEIEAKIKDYDVCVIHNQSIKEDALGLVFMSFASQNLIVLDSRKTAEKNIIKIELLKDEYALPNVWFVLNKVGYNPSLVVEAKKIWNKYIKK